jgi:hypothetical protein
MAKKKAVAIKKPEKKVAEAPRSQNYRIISGMTMRELETNVDEMIEKSWKLCGGVAVTSNALYQAVYKQ